VPRGARVATAALKAVGKDYRPDPDLPGALVAGEIRRRLVWLARGLIRLRAPVFVGPNVVLRGKGGLHLGRGVTFDRGVQVDGYARDGVTIGPRTRIGAHSVISCTSHLSRYGAGVTIGADSGLGEFGFIGAAGGVTIGDNVIMGQYVSFHAQEHVFGDVGAAIRSQGTVEAGIVVERDCWVGARVTFLDGAHVGAGSVVAAGAVVRGTFPPRSVLGGVPARLLKTRE
jgi:acetyltransferase-like isoleucine patch superfamily enzyme